MKWLQGGELKVGILVVSVATLIAFMSMQVSDDPNFLRRANKAWFMLPDAGGLVKGSQIKTAGIPVGVIKDIKLEEGRARVELSLNPDMKLTVSAAARIRSAGILGDRYIDITPGLESDPPLGDDGQIINVKDSGGLDSVVSQVGEIGGSLKEVAEILRDSVKGDGTREHSLGRIVNNIERLTADISQITSENKNKIGAIIDQVNGITKTLDEALNDPSDKGFKARWKVALDRIDSSLKNIDEITGKINRGEGTIGKLVNDESTIEQVNEAVEGISGFLGTAEKAQTGLDFHSAYLGNIGSAKTTVGLRIQPGLDRYYMIGIVDDPAGVVKTVDIKTTPDGGLPNKISEEKTYKNETKFTAIFAKNFYDFTVKGGLIENSGGLGVDYHFYRRKFRIGLEALEFSKLNLRASLQYNVYKGIYAIAGAQDILNRGQKYSGYLGAGLLLTNDDLKMLLSKMPL